LSTWCDGLIEASWLLALVVAALFFNVWSNRTFEPDKIVLVRSLALVAVMAWVMGVVERSGGERAPGRSLSEFLHRPMVAPALLYAAITLLATAVSVVPHLSLWGSYQRLQGTYTTLACVALFLLAVTRLNEPRRWDRLMTMAIWTSIPVALYGLVQQAGWDPVVWATGFGQRVASTLGNPIFAGGYLIVVVPLTLTRAILVRRRRQHRTLAAYGLLLAMQVICIALTLSRGPLLGLAAGLFAFAWLMAAVRGRRSWLMACATAAGVVVLLLVMVMAGFPLAGWLTGELDLGRGTALQRILTWQGVISMATAGPLRTLLGYGPETMIVAFPRYFPPELAPLPFQPGVAFDRAHNVIMDELATRGIAGVAVYLLVVAGFFFYGLRHMGLITDRRGRQRYWMVVLLGVMLGVALVRLVDGGWHFVGLGASAGTLAAVLGYAGFSGWMERLSPGDTDPLPAAGLLAAGVAHFVELQTGIAVIATRLLFWLLIALVVTMPARETISQPAPSRSRRGRRRLGRRADQANGGRTELVAGGLLMGTLLATIGFALITPQGDPGVTFLALGLILGGTWALGFGVWDFGFRSGQSASVYAYVSWSWALAFLLPHLLFNLVIADGTLALYAYVAYMAVTAGLVAVMLTRPGQAELPFASSWAWMHLTLAALVVMLIISTNLNVARADIDVKLGLSYANAGRFDEAIPLFERATRLAPYQDSYALYLAGAYAEKGRTLGPPESETWFQRAQGALEWGQRLNPLNPDHPAKLGLLHRLWADAALDPSSRRQHLQQAVSYYQEAATLSPQAAQIHSEMGLAYQALGDLDAAIAEYERAATLNPRTLELHLRLADALLARGDLGSAVRAFRRAVTFNREGVVRMAQDAVAQRPQDFAAHRDLAVLHWVLGDRDQAVAEMEVALQMAPAEDQPALQRLMTVLQSSELP
jgi:tetratricopeptide (TPR) repeat protein